jgi:hypothetical protein
MVPEAVRAALAQLQAEGQRISVRAIHGRIGGSFRDITRYLREVLPGAEGGAMPASEVLPRLNIADHPEVQDVRARLRALAGEEPDLQRRVRECDRTVTVLQAQLEAVDNAIFLGHQPASDLEKVRTTLAHALREQEAARRDLQVYQARASRLQGLAREIEAKVAAQVAQHERAAYRVDVQDVDDAMRLLKERLRRMRARQASAREQFPRTVLPHVEPQMRVLQPGQVVGLEELFYVWEHDRERQRILEADAAAC